jgi:hypothetical protein
MLISALSSAHTAILSPIQSCLSQAERIIIRRSEASSDSSSSDNDMPELSENSDLSGVELLDE